MLDVRRLHVLCEVARHGSFSAAATALGYTQPAISRQIATLEAEVGTALVRRVPAGAVVPDAGPPLRCRGRWLRCATPHPPWSSTSRCSTRWSRYRAFGQGSWTWRSPTTPA